MPFSYSIEEIVTLLAAVPQRIAQMIQHSSTAELDQSGAPGIWSAANIIAHLRASDAITCPRIYAILVRDNPTLLAFDDRRWAALTGIASLDPHTSLTTWTLQRAELVTTLQHCTAADWQRIGTHEITGPQSLETLVRGLIGHELEHCAQIEDLLYGATRC